MEVESFVICQLRRILAHDIYAFKLKNDPFSSGWPVNLGDLCILPDPQCAIFVVNLS